MTWSLRNWMARLQCAFGPAPKRSSQTARPALEALESRELLSAAPLRVAVALHPTAAHVKVVRHARPRPPAHPVSIPTEVSALASQLQAQGLMAKPNGPTQLFLNFDGFTGSPEGDVKAFAAFAATPAQNGTASTRDAQIQDILYRTSEVFAPFNVQVSQIFGDGVSSKAAHATTIFVGGYDGGPITPASSMDYPMQAQPNHMYNSDSSDVAFVEQGWSSLTASHLQAQRIVAAIAHEAGHTFGLAHVRTDGVSEDPKHPMSTGVSYDPSLPTDVMSYDSNDDYFSNVRYNLTVSNGAGVDASLYPEYKTTYLATQNSFAYLQTTLGARPAASSVGVIDENLSLSYDSGAATLDLVDPGYYQANAGVRPATVQGFGTVGGTLQRADDYAAYRLQLPATGWNPGDTISIMPTGSSNVNIMVYDETPNYAFAGSQVAFATNHMAAEFTPDPNHVYYVVVGGAFGEPGAFSLGIGPVKEDLQGRTFTLRDAAQNVTGSLAITHQSGGTFTATFTAADGSTLAVNGQVGGLINGASAINFFGQVGQTTQEGPDEYMLTTVNTIRTVKFTGQVTESGMGINLAGQGQYVFHQTKTVKDVRTNKGTQTETLRTSAIVSGFASTLQVIEKGLGTGLDENVMATA